MDQLDRIEHRLDSIDSDLRVLFVEIATLKAKSTVWGVVGGALAIAITMAAKAVQL